MFVSTIQSPLASEVLKFGPNNAGKSNELNAFQFVLLHMVPFGKKKKIRRLFFITPSGNCQVSKYVTYFCAKFQVVRIIVLLELFIVRGKYHATFNRV
jgi:hypothetical protein